MSGPFRWGILGARSGIYQKRLKPAFESTDRHPVVAEASRSDDGLAAYDALLADDGVDGVYLPLPNALHAPWILRSLEAGKHVLCEKPLTMSAADTERVVAAARASGLALVEAYMAPHHPRFQLVQALARDGLLGALHLHRAAFTFDLDRPDDHRWDARGGGALLDVGVYCLAPALDLAGREPVALAAAATTNAAGVDTSMTGWLDFGAGFQAMFEVSFEAPFRRRQEIVGSDGVLTIDDPVPGPLEPGQPHDRAPRRSARARAHTRRRRVRLDARSVRRRRARRVGAGVRPRRQRPPGAHPRPPPRRRRPHASFA